MNYILAPSILSSDFAKLGEQVKLCESAGAPYIHLDVMDGMFVPNISFGIPVISSIRKKTDMVFDVHLMIEDPIRYISDFRNAGADFITVHYEAVKHLDRSIDLIKKSGAKASVALNPATGVEVLKDILPLLDMVLLMSVNPGFGGQKYIPYVSNKIRELKTMISNFDHQIDIEVDGGITMENISEIKEAGANVFVAGSSVFKGDIYKNIKKYLEIIG